MTHPARPHPAPATADSARSPLSALRAGHWTLDPAHSAVGFRHKSVWGLVTVKGSFSRFAGAGELTAEHTASGTLTIEAASVATGKPKLDTHLLSADFFDVERYPEFTFVAERVTATGEEEAEVSGGLTVLGTSRPLSFTARATSTDPDHVTLDAEFDVDRSAYAMTWNRGGMLKGLTHVVLSARFSRDGAGDGGS